MIVLPFFEEVYFSLQIDVDDLDPEALEEQPASRMLVLERFDLPQDFGAVLDGWVFSCKSEILNLQQLLHCSSAHGLYVSCDGTYKLTNHDWVLLNLISETIVDSHGGKCYSWTALYICMNLSACYVN
jgi:hypothetical protein